MITTLIGKTFLKAYNGKYKQAYSAKEFFEQEYFEVFFNHPKYMQWVTNSPFVQMKAGQKPEKLTIEERKEKLLNLFSKVETEAPDASFAIGFPASESKEYASTSGLVSDVSIETDQEDIYYSWIGSGLGIGVAGGYNLLINDATILLETFEGWKIYRKYLNDPTLEKLRGNQINSWNGQWLTYKLGTDFDVNFDFATLEEKKIFKKDVSLVEVNTVNWSNLFFSLCQLYPSKVLNTYVYSLGQTNKTVGFIPFYLKAGSYLIKVFKQLFDSQKSFENKEFQAMYGMHIKRACELGNIGLHALRPDNLKKYMNEDKNLSFKKEEDNLIYQSYKTWLIAMLSKNKEEILQYTEEIAKLLVSYSNDGTKTDKRNFVKDKLLQFSTKLNFLNSLEVLLKDIGEENKPKIKELRNDTYLMNDEECKYLVTLLKFDFSYYNK